MLRDGYTSGRRADGRFLVPDGGLDRWIDGLHDRLDHGGLDGLGSIDLGDGTGHLPGNTTIRVMLADLADLDDPDGSAVRDPAWREERRDHLLDDFCRLR